MAAKAKSPNPEAPAKQEVPAVLTVSEFQSLSAAEKEKFRRINGTVCEDHAKPQ